MIALLKVVRKVVRKVGKVRRYSLETIVSVIVAVIITHLTPSGLYVVLRLNLQQIINGRTSCELSIAHARSDRCSYARKSINVHVKLIEDG